MRVLLGLAALAAVTVDGQFVSRFNNVIYGNSAAQTPVGAGPFSTVAVREATNSGQVIGPATVSPAIASGVMQASNNWLIYTPSTTTALLFDFFTNIYTGQMQYRWSPNYINVPGLYPGYGFSAQSYTCDDCTAQNNNNVGTAITCNTATGPGGTNPTSPTNGFPCASLSRSFLFYNLIGNTQSSNNGNLNKFSMQIYDIIAPGPNTSSYSFTITRRAPAIVGDPQISGLQGQDFQVHGIPDEIFNMITYPNLQVNARFVYLSSGACHDNFTACFAHPGTYISEEGIRLGSDKIHVQAGSFKRGLTVSINGQKMTGSSASVKLGSIELVNHRRVVIKTPIMSITVSNSDKFLNQETALFDQKLLALGAERRSLLIGEAFHPEVPLHGLQGQTWRNVEYPSGLEYEGSISDYHVTSGNLFGSEFLFNQYKH